MANLDRRSFVAGLGGAAAFLLTGDAARLSADAADPTGNTPDPSPQARRPNIVYILADDLGWGDLGIYNPHSAAPTPILDAFARQGLRFTDMHSSDAVCTPSRYSILTGRYCWRTGLTKGVLN